ncbi:MAG TPA: DUF1707 and FHA domain-containing protein [Solirubrobacteraceae bacterium]|nr:DUF1707 and FHA domain-containing protein [Solirubrobacteraceae bacterium]
MRASDRDRDRAVALLQARCAEGYLSVETFEHRLGLALAARTSAQLRALVADIVRIRRRPWLRALARGRPLAAVALPAEGTAVVGRSRRCDVVVTEPTVSRRHVELRALDGSWLAVDLGSTNGTWLLGRRIGRARVVAGDELVLGDCPVVLDAG